jgi:hypothetical protein
MTKPKKGAMATIFLPLTKVDEDQRLVYGRITQEELDKAGEVMDYETSKPFFEKWSQGIEAASGGLSKGNVRVMHQAQVAGKLTSIDFNDDDKAIDVCSKIVDDNEWEKVLEGCYTGFSVGGSYAKRWTDAGVKKYTANPTEVSIVDNPCITSATFMLTKADGSEQEIMFKSAPEAEVAEEGDAVVEETAEVVTDYTPTNDELTARAEKLAKDAGTPALWANHVDTAREQLVKEHQKANGVSSEEGGDESLVEAAADETTQAETAEKVTPAGVKQVWQASDGETFGKKEECVAHEETLNPTVDPNEDPAASALRAAFSKVTAAVEGAEEGRTEAVEAGPTDVEGETEDPEFSLSQFERVAKAVAHIEQESSDVLQKSMWTVSSFASTLSSLAYLVGDVAGLAEDDGIGTQMKGAVKVFCDAFQAYAAEEISRLLANLKMDQVEGFCCAAGVDGADGLTKDVAALIELTKDETATKRESLSKLYTGTGEPEGAEEGAEDLSKVTAQRDSLRKVVEELTPQVVALAERLEKVENTPLPRAPKNIVEKGGSDAEPTREELMGKLASMVTELGADKVATMLIKASQATGGHQLTLTPR